MTDIYTHHYSTAFRGLLTSLEVSICVIALCSLGWELSKRSRRNLEAESHLWRVNNETEPEEFQTQKGRGRKLSRAKTEANLHLQASQQQVDQPRSWWKWWGAGDERGFGWRKTESNTVKERRWGWRDIWKHPQRWGERFLSPKGEKVASSEAYAMSHLFQIRCHMSYPCIPSPPYPKWPVLWMLQVWKWDETFFKERCGGDVTTYVKFLMGCLLFTLLQTVTTLPILLPIHLTISVPANTTDPEDITRASLSNLVSTHKGRSYLPVHVVLLYWITFTWFLTLLWIGKGVVDRRREELRKLVGEEAELSTGHASGEGDRQIVRSERIDLPIETRLKADEREIRGWRFRTIMVTNIPLDMRSTPVLAHYFSHYLSKPPPPDFQPKSYNYKNYVLDEFSQNPLKGVYHYFLRKFSRKNTNGRPRLGLFGRRTSKQKREDEAMTPDLSNTPALEDEKGPIVTKIVWVRKISELHQQMARRNAILTDLERGHIALAKNVMRAVEERVREVENEGRFGIVDGVVEMAGKGVDVVGEVAHKAGDAVGEFAGKVGDAAEEVVGLVRKVTKKPGRRSTDQKKRRSRNQSVDEDQVEQPAVVVHEEGRVPKRKEEVVMTPEEERDQRENERYWGMSKTEQLDLLVTALKDFIPQRDNAGRITSTPAKEKKEEASTSHPVTPSPSSSPSKTIWEALADLPKALLDPYQPLTQFKYIFAGDPVPLIDYSTAKLNLITAIVDDLRSRPDAHQPTGVAFVTLREPELVWRAKKELDGHPKRRVFDCRVKYAPDVRDLDWEKLAKVSLRTDVLRAGIVEAGMWVFTLFWIIPVTAIVTLVSIEKLSDRWGALARWLNANPKTKSLLSTLVPIFLTSILSLLAPQMIRVLSLKGQKIVVRSKLFYKLLCRYWKWLFFNILIAFCVGTVAIQSFLFTFRTKLDPVETIASAFPNAAAFFVGWFILQAALHSAVEQLNILGIIDWFLVVRKADTPRRRTEKAIPRAFNYYYWLPNHLLVVSIVLIFSLLNPLVIPFALLYFLFAVVVFKNQFGRIYYRRWYEGNGKMIYVRLLRYSLDGLFFAQLIIVALMFFLKLGRYGGACIPTLVLTVAFKLSATRVFKAHMKSIDREEADLYCGIHDEMMNKAKEAEKDDTDGRKEVENPQRPPLTKEMTAVSTISPLKPTTSLDVVHYHTAPVRSIDSLDGHSDFITTPATISEPLVRRESSPILKRSSSFTDEDYSGWRKGKSLQEPSPPEPEVTKPLSLPSLVKPFPNRRWDDRANHSAQYDDPAFTTQMNYRLWLPKDPLKIINLDDTIEWCGHALVSTKGGNGKIGGSDWEPFLEQLGEEQLVVESPASEGVLPSLHDLTPLPSQPLPQSMPSPPLDLEPGTININMAPLKEDKLNPSTPPTHRRLQGKERLKVAEEVAAQIKREERQAAARPTRSQTMRSDSSHRPPTLSSSTRRISAHSAASIRPTMSRDVSSPTSQRRAGRYDSLFRERSPSLALSERGSITQQEALIEEVLEEERKNQSVLKREEEEETEQENKANATTSTWKKIFYQPGTAE
ncbi:hypothetical protein BT69DRAFT_1243474 [Atractiella rhizophila]|nr:hypothetical protein BT69DRAFT_1243474 [Atractiella rhizophila]